MFRDRAQGIVTWGIVGVISIVFALFGLSDSFSFGSDKNTAAQVNGEKISWQTVDVMYRNLSHQYADQQMDPQALKNHIIRVLVQRSALTTDARKKGFRVGEEQMVSRLVRNPSFQEEGKFSEKKYHSVIAQAAYTDRKYREELVQDILVEQVQTGIVASNFTTPGELKKIVGIVDQTRDVGYAKIPAHYFKKKVKLSQEHISDYYEQHKAEFIKPEEVTLEYIELSLDQLASGIKPTANEVKSFYEANTEAYTLPERAEARHILISVSGHDEATDTIAKSKAEALIAALKEGADFAALAEKESQDSVSAKQGGNLGWISRGQTVPEFEAAVFSLTPGALHPEPVRSTFGYHVIQLVSHKASSVRPFKEVSDLVKEQLVRERASEIFTQKSEQLERLAFENASSLASVGAELELDVSETAPFGRSGGEGLAALQDVIQVAFSEEFLQGNRNSDPIRLSDDTLAVIRLKKHEPTRQLDFEQAKSDVVARLTDLKMASLLQDLTNEFQEKMKSGKKPSVIAQQHGLKWIKKTGITRGSSEVDNDILGASFQIAAAGDTDPSVRQFILEDGSYLILSLDKVKLGDLSSMDPNAVRGYSSNLTEMSGQLDYISYIQQTMQTAKIEVSKSL